MRTFAAILLDLDGTLVDSEPLHFEAHKRFLRTRGIIATDADVLGNVGKGDVSFYRLLMQRHNIHGDANAWVRDKMAMLLDLYRNSGLKLMAGARDLLDHAHAQGVPVCVVTSSERHVASAALQATGLEQRLHSRVCYEDTAAHKPDPAPYVLAAQRLSVPIQRCLVIEDSISGVTAGAAAGAIVVGFPGLITESLLLDAGAGRCITRLDDLVPLHAQPGATSSIRRAVKPAPTSVTW